MQDTKYSKNLGTLAKICDLQHIFLSKETILHIWKMSVFDKRGMWTISTSNYANYLQCMTAQNDVEEDKFTDARGKSYPR